MLKNYLAAVVLILLVASFFVNNKKDKVPPTSQNTIEEKRLLYSDNKFKVIEIKSGEGYLVSQTVYAGCASILQISEINAPVDFVKAASEHLKSRNCKSVASGNIVTTDFEHNGITVLLYINSVYGDLEREYLLESTNEFNKYTDWGKSNKHIKENKCNAQDIFDDYIAEDPWFEGKNDTFMSEFQKEKMKNTIICQSFRIKADAMGCHNATLSIC